MHFITFSCDDRKPYLASPHSKQVFEATLERTRARHNARVYGYVLMPEHVHLLLNETFDISLAMFLKSVKQETSRQLKGTHARFWLPRYFDFNVQTPDKFYEKLQYIHRNPVTRGLVANPADYPWSSYNHYATGHRGTIEVESDRTARLRTTTLP